MNKGLSLLGLAFRSGNLVSGEFYCWGLKEELGHAIGKEFRASIAVTDQGFAEALLKQLDK